MLRWFQKGSRGRFLPGRQPESAEPRQKVKSLLLRRFLQRGLDYNRILVLPSLRVERIQSREPEQCGITINFRGNERCLSTGGNCAPDRDQRYQIQSEQTQEVVLIRVRDVEISYNREKMQKRRGPDQNPTGTEAKREPASMSENQYSSPEVCM